MSQINRRADESEIIHYDGLEMPIYVDADSHIFSFPNREMLAHWHDDVEYIRVWKGRMVYYVNDVDIPLQAGQAVLINSRQLHHGCADPIDGDTDCVYLAIRFHPEILSSNIALRSHYIEPVMNAPVPYFLLEEGDPICQCLDRAAQLHREKAPAFEMRVLSQLNQMWALLYERIQREDAAGASAQADPDVAVQKRMADYIYRNYSHKLSLHEVAQAGGVCKSKCCQIFKKYLRKTPGEFLMAYRLEAAAHMLRTTAQSVTEIAYACGFNSPSYFTESFRREHGCTPRHFRQRVAQEDRETT